MMNRRSFLSRSLLTAASFGVSSTLPRGRRGRYGLPKADAAPQLTPYPVLVVIVGGGLDPAMHMVARANGSVGGVNIVNRLNDSSSFRRTKSGIDYVSSVVTPVGGNDFEAHLEDLALIRALNLSRTAGITAHTQQAAPWFGDSTGSGKTRFDRLPWASLLAAQFRKRGFIVPKPCAVAYTNDPATFKNDPYIDYLAYGNTGPDPETAPDRIITVPSYFNALSTVGLPDPKLQAPGNALIDALDQGAPSATQPDYAQRFAAANGTAKDVLGFLTGGSLWPPKDPKLFTTLGLDPKDANRDLSAGNVRFEHMFTLAYLALANNIAHVIAFKNDGQPVQAGTGWDSHEGNVARQTKHGNELWSSLGKLITLMKKTPSRVVLDGRSMFDTTNIWIISEMGRSPQAQVRTKKNNVDVPPYQTDGTEHWSHGSSFFIGGRFKRGAVFGDFTPTWTAVPINPVTGSPNGGIEMSFNHVIATVMKAAGGDPSEFTKAPPIDAVLDMSR